MHWIDSVEALTELPAVLVAPMGSTDARRGALRALAARALRLPLAQIEVAHARDLAPRLASPAASGLRLSSASRGGLATLALARQPIGVDVETVSEAEPPWGVLHPDERDWLSRRPANERRLAFARLWSAKEAYLKALGLGLSRAPDSFAVRVGENGEVEIDDPATTMAPSLVASRLLTLAGDAVVVSVVLLDGRSVVATFAKVRQAPSPGGRGLG